MDALPDADPLVAGAWSAVGAVVAGGPLVMGLAAGDRPAADVEVLAGALASCEYELARRMHAAAVAGCLPLVGEGAMLAARGWSRGWARRLARCAGLAASHPELASVWAAGVISSEHVDPVARLAGRFTAQELSAVIEQLLPTLGRWSPHEVGRFVAAAVRLLHPPDDPDPGEADAYESRYLSFALTRDSVLLSGELPRVEGEALIAAIDALAERLRSTADHVPAGARRADALIGLVEAAHARDALPARGGLPVALSVGLDVTPAGDPVWATSRGRLLTGAEARWAGCQAAVTPVLVTRGPCPEDLVIPVPRDGHTARAGRPQPTPAPAPDQAVLVGAGAPGFPAVGGPPGPAVRIAALAAALFDTRIPLAVGRTERTATPAQRRALVARDSGCVIPGCGVPAEACQVHHLDEWAAGGSTDLPNLAMVCWAHHRQVDLRMWRIEPAGSGPPPPRPPDGAAPGTPWPANHGAPFVITRTPRHTWRT